MMRTYIYIHICTGVRWVICRVVLVYICSSCIDVQILRFIWSLCGIRHETRIGPPQKTSTSHPKVLSMGPSQGPLPTPWVLPLSVGSYRVCDRYVRIAG